MGEAEMEEFLENLKAMHGLMRNLREIQRRVAYQERVIQELDKISTAMVEIERIFEEAGSAV